MVYYKKTREYAMQTDNAQTIEEVVETAQPIEEELLAEVPAEPEAEIPARPEVKEEPEAKPEQPKKKGFYTNPQFWVVVCCVLMLVCIVIFVLAELAKPVPQWEEETLATEATQITEATLPPPPANPIGLGDFEFSGDYLTCTSTTSVLGIDVSEWQKQIDWQQVKDAGIEFAMVRVAWRGSEQGVLTEDTYARANLAGAAEAGIKVGAYIFSQAITPDEAVEEANFLLDIIKDYDIQMPLVFDWEFIDADARTGQMDAETLTACSQAFCNTVTLAGYQPMIYFNTNQSFQMLELRELVDYPFWLAQYDTVLNYPYKIDMWQYTETGTVPGIATAVDINLYFPWEETIDN